VLQHLAGERMLEANAALLDPALGAAERERALALASHEVHCFTQRFRDAGWACYWYVLDDKDVDPLHLREVYDVTTGRRSELAIDELNATVDAILVRTLGPVEIRRGIIGRYFARLGSDFRGITINDPRAAQYGLRKDYLFELMRAGVPTIPTAYFPRSVAFAELADRYAGALRDHIIKPVTGELSNSFALLADIDEQSLRWKERKVGGWLVQPIAPEIWNGEYQLLFIGDRCANGCRKVYERYAPDVIVPSQEHRRFELYAPSADEVQFALGVRDFFLDRHGLHNDIFRLDFVKDADGAPVLLEFEMVNPGSFIRYLEDEAAQHAIADVLLDYLTRRLGTR
jgi:hypothetical protein